MKKILLLLTIFCVVIISLVIVILLPNLKGTSSIVPKILPTPTSVVIPQTKPTVKIIPTGETVIINNIPVNNFYQNSPSFNPEGDRTLADVDGQYRIVYLSENQQFLLNIQGSPFEQYRQAAEQAFLQKMGISQQQACNLNVIIRTPAFVNPDQAGQDYFLSFCQ